MQNHDNDEEMLSHTEDDYDADDEIPDKNEGYNNDEGEILDKNEGYNNDESHNKAKAGRNPYKCGNLAKKACNNCYNSNDPKNVCSKTKYA